MSSKLAVNIPHFARLLRAAGLPIGTNKILRDTLKGQQPARLLETIQAS